MDAQVMARWQFGITTVYHYLFVPITISMSMLVAVLQTIWYRTGKERYLQLTKFFGKLFLINFALGVVTGIVQEFQFGMNWSEYSRFVGDVFGAPLALEALLAFFLESTFLGLWIFGWDRLPKRLHLMTIYLAAIGTHLSSIFILAANSWMQNPVGATYNPATGRAELSDFGAVLVNPVFLATFPHTLSAAYVVGGGLIAGVAGWHLVKHQGKQASSDTAKTWRWATRFGAWILLVASVFLVISGDFQGKVMTRVQPMKMAAAEAHYNTSDASNFSILSIGPLDGSSAVRIIQVPGLLGFLANGTWGSPVQGINDLQAQYQQSGYQQDDGSRTTLQQSYADELRRKGVASIAPNVPLSYWTFRIMMGLGFVAMFIAVWVLWATRKGRTPKASRWWTYAMIAIPLTPLLANSFGWVFAEMGRQPWLVAGVLPTLAGVSPSVSLFEVWTSLIIYTLLYGALAVVEVGLFLKFMRLGLPDVAPVEISTDEDAPLSFAY